MNSLMSRTPSNPSVELAFQVKQHELLSEKSALLQQIKSDYEDGVLSSKDTATQLIELVSQACAEEKSLRKEFSRGETPSFVSTQLENLLGGLNKDLQVVFTEAAAAVVEKPRDFLAEDEMIVYVYLFNSSGQALRSWRALLAPSIFKEASVHRPVYLESEHVHNLIRSKADKSQHACVAVKIKKTDVLGEIGQDEFGHPFMRLKYGVLYTGNIISFINLDRTYRLDQEGALMLV